MFFKRRPAPVVPTPVEPSPVVLEPTLADRADTVARALRSFEEKAYEDGHVTPDAALVQAHETVAAATKVVRDGRLAYALLRQLLSETRTWHAWSLRDDFETLKHFACTGVVAVERKEPAGYRTDTIKDIFFVFNGRPYRLVHLDKGYSLAPESNQKWGDVSFYAGDTLVLSVSATEEVTDDYWKFQAVNALRVGDGEWMKDLLQIASDIEQTSVQSRNKWADDATLEAAKNIQM